jgi:hypothetical protein
VWRGGVDKSSWFKGKDEMSRSEIVSNVADILEKNRFLLELDINAHWSIAPDENLKFYLETLKKLDIALREEV